MIIGSTAYRCFFAVSLWGLGPLGLAHGSRGPLGQSLAAARGLLLSGLLAS